MSLFSSPILIPKKLHNYLYVKERTDEIWHDTHLMNMEPLLQLYEIDQEEWKEGNFLPVKRGTESSAVDPVLSFSSGTIDKSKSVDGNDTNAAHTGGYSWSIMEGDGADVKDGGLGSEWLMCRCISLTSLCHQSSFSILFLGPSVFFTARLSLFLVLCIHPYFMACTLQDKRLSL